MKNLSESSGPLPKFCCKSENHSPPQMEASQLGTHNKVHQDSTNQPSQNHITSSETAHTQLTSTHLLVYRNCTVSLCKEACSLMYHKLSAPVGTLNLIRVHVLEYDRYKISLYEHVLWCRLSMSEKQLDWVAYSYWSATKQSEIYYRSVALNQP